MLTLLIGSLFGIASASGPASRPENSVLPPHLRNAIPPNLGQERLRLPSPDSRAAATRPAPTTTRRSEPDSGPAVQEILKRCSQDQAKCIDELLRLWMERSGRDSYPLNVACWRVAPGDAPELFKRILSLLASPDNESACGFFGEAARSLIQKLPDPEPVLKSAVERNCWQAIPRFECAPALKERYIIQGLTKCQTADCDVSFPTLSRFSPGSIVDCFTEAGIVPLRQIVHNMRDKPSHPAFRVAAQTLAELEDARVIPELEYALNNSLLGERERMLYRFLVVRSKAQNNPQEVLNILRTEKDNLQLLYWAIFRGLLLKVPAKAVDEALLENGSAGAGMFEPWVSAAMAGDRLGDKSLYTFVEPFSMSVDERKRYWRALREGAEDLRAVHLSQGLRALVASAPAGD